MPDDEPQCPTCGRTFPSEQRMRRHAESAHGSVPGDVPWTKVAAAVAVLAVGVAGASLFLGGGSGGVSNMAKFGADDDPYLGNASAPVTVVAFESPACPSCAYFHRNDFPGIQSRYVDTGKIAFYYSQFAIGYRFDRPGGIAQQCVHRHAGNEAFFNYTGEIYQRKKRGGEPPVGTSNVEDFTRDFANRHGLDGDAILSCYRNEGTADAYEADIQAGKDNAVRGTPYFFVFVGDETAVATGAGGLEDAIQTKLGEAGAS